MDTSIAVPKASTEVLPELAEFLAPFAPLFRRSTSRHSLERYVTGLLTDLGRKNCDTIAALVAGTSTERLQHLLTDAEWDPLELEAARVRMLSSKSPKGLLVLNATDLPKQGKRSVGVDRQYSGSLGKLANCQVIVSAEYVADALTSPAPLHWPVNARLYLPEEWASDPERRRLAHVPEGSEFQTKPEIALSLVDRSCEWEVPFKVVVGDSGYGDNPNFLMGLEERGIPYVCAVESSFGVRIPEEAKAALEAGPPPYKGKGQPPKPRLALLYTAKEVIESLPEEAWRVVSWRQGTKGELSKRMVAIRVHRGTGSPRHSTSHSRVSTGPEGWLVAERSSREERSKDEAGEIKYYFASLAADTPLKRLGELAHSRWAIEQFYEDAKGECGLGDYQGRRWDGLHRHLALSMLSYSFLMVESIASSHSDADATQASLQQGFFPLKSTYELAGNAQASTRVVPRGSGALVHRYRPHQPLPPTQKLTK
ncbi:MAG: IS701 family transposase [Chloroflexota bacterium]|nr:IS701 family transposase [Chloroflexota bacterium]